MLVYSAACPVRPAATPACSAIVRPRSAATLRTRRVFGGCYESPSPRMTVNCRNSPRQLDPAMGIVHGQCVKWRGCSSKQEQV
ncbi:hypothetical protein BJV77DRAFT_978945 [Russula vinacea]|nr:hypothetical protein BJV77DRAFT_978945 [Russula vinacea]